jgi:DNA (cytosine-5)-methyltransferase 1
MLKYIDLFCGIGGFHQAFKILNDKYNIKSECVFACDIDKNCRKSYLENYNIEPFDDIKKINPKEFCDKCDIICGGFPCQPFSNGGNKKNFEDERGLLFNEIIKLAIEKKPKFMFLENVKHILKISNGLVYQYILNELDKIGYKVQTFLISPDEYGIPQQRQRVYFVCIRNDIYKNKPIELIDKKTDKIDLKSYLLKKKYIDSRYFLSGDILDVLNAWDEFVKIFEVNEKISPTILINDIYKNYTKDQFNNLVKWRQDYLTKNYILYNKYKKQIDKWYNKYKNILSQREIYGKLEWQTGLIKENESIFNHFIQIRQSGIRVKKNKYFPTLVAISQIPIYGKEKRYITPRECARIQSFPDTFKLDKNDKISYKQLGNSVNVSNVITVIRSTLEMYKDKIIPKDNNIINV